MLKQEEKPKLEVRDLVLEDFDDEDFIRPICEMETTKENVTPAELKEIFLKRQSTTDTMIALLDGKIVGMAALAVWHSFSGRSLGIPMDLYVFPKYRRQGIATEFMTQIMGAYKTRPHGVWRILGPVDEDLVSFYQQFGFQRTDLIYMERKLV